MAEITAGSAEADWLASEFCIWLLRDWLEGVVDIRRKVRVPPLVDRPDLDHSPLVLFPRPSLRAPDLASRLGF